MQNGRACGNVEPVETVGSVEPVKPGAPVEPLKPVERLEPYATLDEACGGAIERQLAGRLDEAQALYHAILQADPNHAAANYALGMLHVQARRPAEAISFLLTALKADSQTPDFWLGYFEALLQMGRTEEARAALVSGRKQGLAGAAVEEFAERLDAAMGAEAERELLATLQRGDATLAQRMARGLTEKFPARGGPWKVYGALLWAEGRVDEALAAMQVSARLLPRDAEAHCNLGLTLTKLERFADAETHLRRALEIDPAFSIAHYRLGMTYSLQGRLDEAAASLRRGLALRARYTEGDDAQNFSNLLFVMSHDPAIDAEELFAEHRRYGEYVEGPLRDGQAAGGGGRSAGGDGRSAGGGGRSAGGAPRHTNSHSNVRDPQRLLKIGMVSGDFYEHPVGQFLEPIVAELARRPGLELHAYCSNPVDDALGRRLQSRFASFTAVNGLSDDACAERIAADRIDVLIDLSGHTADNRLPVFARKAAPVQASWLGYPGTTGLTAMDYYLADRVWLPPGFERMFTEKLVYLPDRWAFRPHADAPAVGPLPASSAGSLTFGSFHRHGKINAACIALWSRLLRELPQTRLLLVGLRLDGAQERLLDAFAAHGVERTRLTVHGRCTLDKYLDFHRQVDIALDALPYAGATTTMHSLSMGVPTLTIAGASPQGRAGAGILGNLGLHDFIAADADDFVARARHWDQRHAELAALRAGLRDRLARSPGGQPAVFAHYFDQALRRMWSRWCQGLPPQAFAYEHR